MNSILDKHISQNKFSHGYLLIGDYSFFLEDILKASSQILRCPVDELQTHPDYFFQKYSLLTIKDSQEIKRKSLLKPILSDSKVFVLEVFSFTKESSNALLKIFEEPPIGTYFFIIVPSVDIVIPTLRSRLIIVKGGRKVNEETEKKAEEFLSSLGNRRLKMIDGIIKDKEKTLDFLNALEFLLNKEKKFIPHLSKIQIAREKMLSRVSNPRLLFEYLALILPRIYNK